MSESSAPVSLLDLWPTLADLVDLPTPEAGLSGRSLVPLLAGEEDPSASEPVMSEAFYGPFWRMSFRQGRFKVRLTFNTEVSPLDTAAVEVFDLVADPGEESPIRPGDDELRDLVSRARAAAASRWSHRAENGLPRAAADDAELEQLRALGYIQ